MGFKVGQKIIDKLRRKRKNENFLPKNFVGNRYIYNGQKASNIILEVLKTGKPTLIARYGTTELSVVEHFVLRKERNNCAFPDHLKQNISDLSGFFPATDELLSRFSCEFIEVCKNIDVLGVRADLDEIWFYDIENSFIENFSQNACLINIQTFTPYNIESPWMQYLKGKKVLVIHPFENTIRAQYQKREKLFKNPDMFLPEFELKTIKAVQSLAEAKKNVPFETWFDALENMQCQIDAIDFDIALIGAGAYGMFLGDYIKKKGRQAVHVGGALQLFFGIRGKRWDTEYLCDLYKGNEYWVLPAKEDHCSGYKKVEDGCYW